MRELLISEFEKEMKSKLNQKFYGSGETFVIDVLEMSKVNEIPPKYEEIPKNKIVAFDVTMTVKVGERIGNKDIVVALYKENDVWKVIKIS